MEPRFWHERWAHNQIGFHLPEVNPYLQRHWPALNLADGTRVLVPLCGKSRDLAWLARQGHRVLGVELSQTAVEAYFSEQGLTPHISRRGPFEVYQAGSAEVWCGDFFALSQGDVADCVALYDRAALIALPPSMREQYAAHLNSILAQGCQGVLITLDYEQALKAGPPFAVPDADVRTLFKARWRLDEVEARDILGESPRFMQAGVTRLDERVYRMLKS